MAFMARLTTAAPSVSASLTIRQPSPLIPSPLGGEEKDRAAGVVFPSYWFWQTRAAATVVLPGPGKPRSRLSCATPLASQLRSLTILPTGASKWNPIEHRLFSEISKNWAAEPLDSYEKMLKFICTTNTRTGLVVTSYLDRKDYPPVSNQAAVSSPRFALSTATHCRDGTRFHCEIGGCGLVG
jgi:hypothetical protein